MEKTGQDIERLLAEKAEIERILATEFTKTIAIMFTDIVGSTSFYEQKGDIEGRAMVHAHNTLVFPRITGQGGVIIKTIGDATMSVFDDPRQAVRSARAIQEALEEYNKEKSDDGKIRVKIGINYGTGIVEEKDVYGDIVNVASRMVSIAKQGEIIVTEALYRHVKSSEDLIFRFIDSTQVKGKSDDIRVYRLVWQDEELHLGKTRGDHEISAPQKTKTIVMEASLSGETLKIGAYEKVAGEERPVRTYREIPYQANKIKHFSDEILSLLNRAGKQGHVTGELLSGIREAGSGLFNTLIPDPVGEILRASPGMHLLVSIDDSLVHIPWELLHDGEDFLCRKYAIGRTVSTRQQVSPMARAIGMPLKMLVLADPVGDLPAAVREAMTIGERFENKPDIINLTIKSGDVRKKDILTKIRFFDIVHYAGHAVHETEKTEESGLVLADGRLSAREIAAAESSLPMPALIFSNACRTGDSEQRRIGEDTGSKLFGLGNAFMLAGVQHYIGTFWEIPDEPGAHFAVSFYTSLIGGATIGEALRDARQSLVDAFGEEAIVWTGYLLYGDPSARYIHYPAGTYAQQETQTLRGSEVTTSKSSRKTMIIAVAGVIIAVAALIFSLKPFSTDRAPEPGKTAQPLQVQQQDDARKRIDELVQTLSLKYREGKFEPVRDTNEWTSKPMTMVIMDIAAGAGVSDDERTKLVTYLIQALQADERIRMVDRELLLKLLEELKLGSSALADPATSLKLGKVLSARLMVSGTILAEPKGRGIILRFIDTETTSVKKVLTEEMPGTKIEKEPVSSIAGKISAWVRADYPLQGTITEVSGDRCTISIGQMQGVKKGDIMDIMKEVKKDSRMFAEIGTIEILRTGTSSSECQIISKNTEVSQGAKVREKKAL